MTNGGQTMNADACPRCGHPEGWALKLRVRAILIGHVVSTVAAFAVGYAVARAT